MPGENSASGFTLLEIMLVIVIMAVTAMMVAPSYFTALSPSLDDEGKRLAQALRLASEEATLSGDAFRVRFRRHGYQFQNADREGVWRTRRQSPYQPYRLPQGIQIVEVRPSLPLTEDAGAAEKGAEAVLADLLLPAEGVRQIANIVLAAEPQDGRRITVRLRPGPGGIAVKKE